MHLDRESDVKWIFRQLHFNTNTTTELLVQGALSKVHWAPHARGAKFKSSYFMFYQAPGWHSILVLLLLLMAKYDSKVSVSSKLWLMPTNFISDANHWRDPTWLMIYKQKDSSRMLCNWQRRKIQKYILHVSSGSIIFVFITVNNKVWLMFYIQQQISPLARHP